MNNLNIPDTYYWKTDYEHINNIETMSEFLNYILPDDYEVYFVDGTYAEIISSENKMYAVHASGNGDFNNHKVDFEQIYEE